MAIVAIAFAAQGTAQAAVQVSAEISAVTFTLIDLDLNDGIQPALNFVSATSHSEAQVSTDAYAIEFADGFYKATSALAGDALSSAAALTGSEGAYASVQLAGSTSLGVSKNGFGSGMFSGSFELTPWTALIVTSVFTGSASTSIGYDGTFSEFASASGTLSLTIHHGTDSYESHSAQMNGFAGFSWDGIKYTGETSDVTGELRLPYANLSSETVVGDYFAEAAAGAVSSISAVPEPGTYGMLLAGLVGIGAVVRNRRG